MKVLKTVAATDGVKGKTIREFVRVSDVDGVKEGDLLAVGRMGDEVRMAVVAVHEKRGAIDVTSRVGEGLPALREGDVLNVVGSAVE